MSDILTPVLHDFRKESERRFALMATANATPALQELLMERWRRSAVDFIADCVWTFDPRDTDGWRERPMVPWDSQKKVIRAICGVGTTDSRGKVRPILLRKSRDQGGSVIIAAVAVWLWLFHRQDQGIMTKAGYQLDDAGYNSLFGKILFTIERLPNWLIPFKNEENWRKKRPPQLEHPVTKALIMGSTTTEGGWRGPRMNYIWVDEAAWIPQMEPILTSIMGACDTPVLVSSVAGKGNVFYKIDAGDGFIITDIGEGDRGWVRTELHYRDDPLKTQEWIDLKKANMTKEQWAQEYEIDYSASAPGRIWPEFDSRTHIIDPATWTDVRRRSDDWDIYEGWDFGISSLTAAVYGVYNREGDTLYLFSYGCWKGTRADDIARDIAKLGFYSNFNRNGLVPTKRIGDPAGKNRDSMLTSHLSNLKRFGISISEQRLGDGHSIRELIRVKLAQGRILLTPKMNKRFNPDLPSVSEVMEQYRREGDKPKKDEFSHAADAIQYIASAIWGARPSVQMLYSN